MKACFNNFITIRGTTSKSGLYINDLIGIPKDLFAKLRTSDQASITEFWNRFYERSVYNFVNRVSQEMSKEFYNYKVVESRTTGEFKDDNNTSTESLSGVEIYFNESKYLDHHILRFKIYVDSVASPIPSIYVYSKIGGTLLDTFTPDSISEGENEFQYYGVYDTEKLYVAYDPSTITLKETKAADEFHDAQYPISSIKQVNGGGIIVDYNSMCSAEKFVCSRLFAFRFALWNFLGEELMKERIITHNINEYTVLTPERAEQLAGYYNKQTEESLMAVLKHHRVNDDKLCFDCRGAVSQKVILP